MKTSKIIIAAVLVILTLAMNAQEKRALYATIIYSHDMNIGEAELSLESWMSSPFETEEIIQIEDWMTSSDW